MPKETEPSGNFDAKIVLSNLESLKLGYKWLPDSHSGKLPILPKTQALPGLSSFCLSHPFAYTPHFSPTAPCQKALFLSEQNLLLLELFMESSVPFAHFPKPDPSPRRWLLWEHWGGQPFPTCWGGGGDRLTGPVWQVEMCISPMFCLVFFWNILSFSYINVPCIVKTLSLCLSYYKYFLVFHSTLFIDGFEVWKVFWFYFQKYFQN